MAIILDLKPLEADAEFRAALLYYLQQANGYIAAIFWDAFPDSARKKKLYQLVTAYDGQRRQQSVKGKGGKQGIDAGLLNSLVPEGAGRVHHLDCYKEDFVSLLRDAMPGERKAAIVARLRERHAIPLNYEQFCEAIDLLRRKRHYLKDYERRKNDQARVSDHQMMRLLGLLLLPSQHQHLEHEIASFRRRATSETARLIDINDIRALLNEARRERREETERIFGKGRSKAILTKSARKDRHQALEALHAKYRHYYPPGCQPRYNLHNFLIRYHFIGKGNIALIETALKRARPMPDEAIPHFEREIEAVYRLAMTINRRLWRALMALEAADKTLTKSQYRTNAAVTGRLRAIRNAVAHNLPFFAAEHEGTLLSIEDLFSEIWRGFGHGHVAADLKERRRQLGELRGDLECLLKKQDFCYASPITAEGDIAGPPRIVRRWTADGRQKYIGKSGWQVDKRQRIRALVANWRQALRKAVDSSPVS